MDASFSLQCIPNALVFRSGFRAIYNQWSGFDPCFMEDPTLAGLLITQVLVCFFKVKFAASYTTGLEILDMMQKF